MTPLTKTEEDFPKGHPARFDYDPASPEAQEWARKNVHPLGERAYPVDSVKSSDTPGNDCSLEWRPGVDPRNPHLEAFTGASPEVAAARKAQALKNAAVSSDTAMTDEGTVNTAKIAEDNAVDFLVKLGHDEETARKILAEQGLDKIAAARNTLRAEA